MKKYFLRIIICIFLCGIIIFNVVSCANVVAPVSGNSANFGYVFYDKNTISYTKTVRNGLTDYSNLYKYDLQSKSEVLLYSAEVSNQYNALEMNAYLNKVDDYIFFMPHFIHDTIQEYSNNIYRIKTDGTGFKKLFDEDITCTIMLFDKDNLYYYDEVEEKLYKAKHDGTNRQVLYEGLITALSQEGGKLYFSEFGMIYSIKKSDGKVEEIFDCSDDNIFVNQMMIYDGYIYYSSDDYSAIYRVKLNGKNKELLYDTSNETSNVYIEYFNVADGVVYFTVDEYGDNSYYAILAITPGNKTPRVVVSDEEEFIHIQPFTINGNEIFFYAMSAYETDYDSEYLWYTIRTTGGRAIFFQPVLSYDDNFGVSENDDDDLS